MREKDHRELCERLRKDALGARSITVQLAVPITDSSGAEVRHVTVRRPTVGDIRRSNAAGSGPVERESALTAALCELAPQDLDKIDAADYDCIEAVILGFRGQRVAR